MKIVFVGQLPILYNYKNISMNVSSIKMNQPTHLMHIKRII